MSATSLGTARCRSRGATPTSLRITPASLSRRSVANSTSGCTRRSVSGRFSALAESLALPHNLYVGIDWSGKGGNGRARGLQIATCHPGAAAPTLVRHAQNWNWRRDEALDLLSAHAAQERVLAGLDFAFSYPFCDAGAYFPGHAATPAGRAALWQTVEGACANAPWFYGGPFLAPASPFAAYFVTQAGAGPQYQHRFRATEVACAAAGANPPCAFHCVGAQ